MGFENQQVQHIRLLVGVKNGHLRNPLYLLSVYFRNIVKPNHNGIAGKQASHQENNG